jgi:hypothetical protein
MTDPLPALRRRAEVKIRLVGKPRGITKHKAAQTRCCRGHPFDVANTHHWLDGRGYLHRQCRACQRLRRRRKSHTNSNTPWKAI